jgi:hypothetical protein
VAVCGGRRHTSPHRDDFLSHFGLLVNCRDNRLLGGVTSSVPAQAASSLISSVNLISGGTLVESLFSEFPDLTRPTVVQSEVSYNIVHHIQTTLGPPVTCRLCRLAPDRLAIAKAEFGTMLRDGTARRSKSSWSSAPHIVPKKGNSWHPCSDYIALNARTIRDRYPDSHAHDYSHQLFGCCSFSKIDLVRAYNPIPIHLGNIQSWSTLHNRPHKHSRLWYYKALQGGGLIYREEITSWKLICNNGFYLKMLKMKRFKGEEYWEGKVMKYTVVS